MMNCKSTLATLIMIVALYVQHCTLFQRGLNTCIQMYL